MIILELTLHKRNAFSTKINEIVKEAGVKQVDLTSHDYDPYYIWDATHPWMEGVAFS